LVSIGNGGPNGGSATQYFTGHFNGEQFINEEAPEMVKWVDQGTDNYAGVTFFNTPGKHPVFIGWMSNWLYAQQVPTSPWRSSMTLPRQLTIRNLDGHTRLLSEPIPNAYGSIREITGKNKHLLLENRSVANKMDFTIDLTKYSKKDTIQIAYWRNSEGDTLLLRYVVSQQQIELDRTKAGIIDFHPEFGKVIKGKRINKSSNLKIQVIIDRSSLELFADQGSLVMSVLVFPRKSFSIFTNLL
jgi:sucrose-6-phosphate hydrolase SacC (GH32 family)